jgi:hypothetical protein
LIADIENQWILSEKGGKSVEDHGNIASLIGEFSRRYSDVRGENLIADTYRRYPYYATRSEIAYRILIGDLSSLKRIEDARPAPGKENISTIGYEGKSLESYLNILIGAGITLLCDVRRNPISRKYGFSKSTLSNACDKIGILYEHLPELGIPSEKRKNLETQADYDALFREYEMENLPNQQRSLEKIRKHVQEGYRVALTCYERLPQQCHRLCIARALEREFGKSFSPSHL